MIPGYIYGLWAGGSIGFIVALILLRSARKADAKNYIVERATPMPLSLVTEQDDVWLRGIVRCEAPLVAPHFGTKCVHYHYKLEERVRKTRSTKHGTETYYTWETRETRSESTNFLLVDRDHTIAIDGEKADFQYLPSTTDTIGNWRHSLSWMQSPGPVSAIGSVSEKKTSLISYANIPLIVTPLSRAEYVKKIESSESWMRGFGFFLSWLGPGVAAYGLSDFLGWPVRTHQSFQVPTLIAAALAGLSVYTPIWMLYIYNTFVTYKVRVENAWRQIDVDLKMRYELIPKLVDTVKGYMKYEQDLLQRVTDMRGKALSGNRSAVINMEMGIVSALSQLTIVAEKYPDLKSQPVVQELFEQLQAIEEKIAHGRSTYNETVKEYNRNVLSFPRVILALLCGFRSSEFFQAAPGEKAVPSAKVSGA